ncbi:unnamed protein product [Nesidiocoris tenuis]|uniref:Uncharacterized protein n=1 Tax=Nesidiocoris tenuis TaxID=355587 RepID=A0A6H5HYQ3_9HEMI|nr:unnamed protein product [Nesidiocoris tenuis]
MRRHDGHVPLAGLTLRAHLLRNSISAQDLLRIIATVPLKFGCTAANLILAEVLPPPATRPSTPCNTSAATCARASASARDRDPIQLWTDRSPRHIDPSPARLADHHRPRVCSLPEKGYNPRLSDDLYRLRNFVITDKGVINYGDSIRDRRSRSNTSINSTNSKISPLSPWQGSCCSQTTDVSTETFDIARYRVVLLGDSGVGKTALVSQFMTSEYMNTYDASLDDEFGEKTVCILLDGEESEVVFIDHPASEMSVAEDILNYLWRESYTKEKTVILVGNKMDLARARAITTNDTFEKAA